MRQQLTMGEHFRRGNALSHLDCRAALPSPAMKSRRRIGHASEPLYGRQPTTTTGF